MSIHANNLYKDIQPAKYPPLSIGIELVIISKLVREENYELLECIVNA